MQICSVCGKVIRESNVTKLDIGAYQHKAPCGAILYRHPTGVWYEPVPHPGAVHGTTMVRICREQSE